ncbi:hypothetical protein T440DRAFT_465606 [Plenodomus tracheiphilus IPT5]|uniref:Osmotin, thaumatin-like protein n=1 Tax=Plenodomus tracheiphilus IPT5 TaxID=1408161 RepID=A0A6A7BHA5_9PLEO|nr:hypothetical protein T440DRAFT_465606 [Plenodomus tracheiphilus IPT5]
MSTVSNTHLFFLVLAAVPFSFSGFMVKQRASRSEPISTAPVVSAAVQAAPTTTTGNEASTVCLFTDENFIASQRFTSTVTALIARRTQSYGSVPEVGGDYGNVTIRNNCNNTLYLFSVGAWTLNGPRTNDSWNAYQDDLMQIMKPNETYTEPFRTTCPLMNNVTTKYCEDYDKLRGQGVSIKISKNTSIADILQLEYALVQNPLQNATYHQLIYDVSLLDCADPGINATITDATATAADQLNKVNTCPGYQGGLSVTFDPDPRANVCKPIQCTGEESPVCPDIYNFDRTRKGEATMACREKYEGNMILDLCFGNRQGGG